MKRFRITKPLSFARATALLLFFGALLAAAACGKKEEGGSSAGGAGIKNRLLLLDTGIEEVNRNTWLKAIEIFEKDHPDTKVEFRPYKDDDYSQGGVLVAALSSPKPPDVYFEWAWTAVKRDGGSGNALDLTPFMTPEFKATIDPHALAGTSLNGKQYLIPMAFDNNNILFYHKKKLADLGIEPPKTWEEFVAACKKLKGAGIQPIFQGNQAAWPAGNWASELAVCYLGPDEFAEAGEKPPKRPLTDPGFVQALTRLKELREAGAFNPDINTLNDNEGLSHFIAGDGAFIFAGSWILDTLREGGKEDLYGLLPRPELPGALADQKKYALANSAGYMIHAKTAHPDLAFDLLKHVMSVEVQNIRIKGGLSSTNVESQKGISSAKQTEVMKLLHETDQWVPAPDISWDRLTAERFYEAVKEVVGGQAEPQAALEAAARDVAQAPK